MTTLSNLLAQAITRGLAREDLPEGAAEHSLRGRATVEIDCTVQKLEDTEARPALKVDWPAVVAYLLKRLGKPCELVGPTLKHALYVTENDLTYLVVDRAYVAAVKAALEEKAAAQDPKPRAGATKLAGQVEIVDWLGHVGTNAEIRLVG